jgi:hypothetical protein
MDELILKDFIELIFGIFIFCLLFAVSISIISNKINKQNEKSYDNAYRFRFGDIKQHRNNL